MDNKAHGHGVLHFRGCQYGGHWENGMERIGMSFILLSNCKDLDISSFIIYDIYDLNRYSTLTLVTILLWLAKQSKTIFESFIID